MSARTKNIGGYPWYRDKTVRERYGFPWAQSTAYRVSFFKPEVFGGIHPAAYIDEGYRATNFHPPLVWIPWNNGCARCLP